VEPIGRRQALQLGALGVAGVVTGGAGLFQTRSVAPFALEPGSVFAEPPVLRSRNGVLRVELDAAQRELELAGRRATVLSYNGGVPGPTLRLRPGDHLQVTVVNRLTAPTNLHVHGLHVSPEGNGDNPFVSIGPGETFDYDYRLAEDHSPGAYWYHPHLHGLAADQVFGGLYGAILVEDDQTVPSTRERLMVVSDLTLDADGHIRPTTRRVAMMGREGELLLVNGQLNPQMSARPGERERWRVVNACTSRYLRLALPGQQLQLLGIDSGALTRPLDIEEVLLAPGNRADLLVTMRAGTSELRTLGYDRGSMGMMGMMGSSTARSSRAQTLAALTIEGSATPSQPDVPDRPGPADLREQELARRRELTLGMGMGMGMGMGFTIDGKEFDHERTDQSVRAGTVEEWTIRNTAPMDHPFHLHVWPMQVVEQDGAPVGRPTRRDVVNVPAGGQTVVRIAFDTFTGRTVYHCHILDHEDAGMMGVIEVR